MALSSAVRSSASRPVAVTTRRGVWLASAPMAQGWAWSMVAMLRVGSPTWLMSPLSLGSVAAVFSSPESMAGVVAAVGAAGWVLTVG